MTWRGRALIGLVLACMGFLSFAVLLSNGSYRLYQQDLEDNRRECAAERKAESHKNSKECQSFLYRTLDDPVAVLTAGLTVATVALFVVTFGLYAAAARQGADAQKAIEATREATQAQSRAWLSIKCALSIPSKGTTHLGINGIYVNLSAKAFNRGNSPALAVFFDAEMSLAQSKGLPPIDKMTNFCDRMRERHQSGLLEAVFPGDEHETGHMLFLPLQDIDESLAVADFKHIAPIVYGCISYRSPYISGIRQTRFLYYVCHARDGEAVTLVPDQSDWLTKPMYLTSPGTIEAD